MRTKPWLLVVPMVLLVAAGAAYATDIPIPGLKLIVVDKMAAASKAKAVFVAKDPAVTKGTGTDPAQIAATLYVAYDAVSGTFTMPQGANWLVNKTSVAKYVNKTAPTGGAVKVSVLKPGSLAKVVGKSLGDTPLDISSAPTGNVYVVDTIINGAETTRLCTQFSGCVHKEIAGGTGHKLVCKGNSVGDPGCTAVPSIVSGCFTDTGDGTIYDTCTGLQWEKKATPVGSGENAADLHDVDNHYVWAGTCSVTTSKFCQPSLAAETACKAQNAPGDWVSGCEQCVGGEGTCNVDPGSITTVWDWVNQVNTANYAGHNDWRLPSESGCNTCYTNGAGGLYQCTSCSAHELETILTSPFPCPTLPPCIAPIFGPSETTSYWSASTETASPAGAWSVYFEGSFVGGNGKLTPRFVRAVRGGS